VQPSPWVKRFGGLIPRGDRVLDFACGSGRHARWLAARGLQVDAVDRDEAALASLSGVAGVTSLHVDLEDGEWPFGRDSHDALVVTNYLFRPRFDLMLSVLREGGVLIYETFMVGNERYGRPRSPEFLLKPGELLERLAGDFCVVAFEQGERGSPPQSVVQRVCAVRGRDRRVRLPD
jgi:SAM-dependent methyltransferase